MPDNIEPPPDEQSAAAEVVIQTYVSEPKSDSDSSEIDPRETLKMKGNLEAFLTRAELWRRPRNR